MLAGSGSALRFLILDPSAISYSLPPPLDDSWGITRRHIVCRDRSVVQGFVVKKVESVSKRVGVQ